MSACIHVATMLLSAGYDAACCYQLVLANSSYNNTGALEKRVLLLAVLIILGSCCTWMSTCGSVQRCFHTSAIGNMLEEKLKTSHQNVKPSVQSWWHSVMHKRCTDHIPAVTMQPSRPATHWLSLTSDASTQPIYCQQKLVEMFCYPGCNTVSRAFEGQSPWWGLPSQCGLRGGLTKTD